MGSSPCRPLQKKGQGGMAVGLCGAEPAAQLAFELETAGLGGH